LKNLYILFGTLILFYGCNNTVENSEKNLTSRAIQTDQNKNIEKREIDRAEEFSIKNQRDFNIKVSVSNNKLIVKNRKESIILINIFSSWCKPCMGQIPYLAAIQKRENKDLLIIGLDYNDNKTGKELNNIFKASGIRYFISTDKNSTKLVNRILKQLKLKDNFKIPLSVIYKNGKLYRYYEGTMPMEMLNTEIRNAKKLL